MTDIRRHPSPRSLLTAFGCGLYSAMEAAFQAGLKQCGFVAGENVQIEYRWANDQYDRLPQFALELVQRRVDVIFANSPSISHAKSATASVPIVFYSGDNPVRLGFVESLNRPGGNLTGVAILSNELAARRISLLSDLVPNTRQADGKDLTSDQTGPSSFGKCSRSWRGPQSGPEPGHCIVGTNQQIR